MNDSPFARFSPRGLIACGSDLGARGCAYRPGKSGRRIGRRIDEPGGVDRGGRDACDSILNRMDVMMRDSTHCGASACPPTTANTPENKAEPTTNQHAIAVVFAVWNTASRVRFPS